MNKKSPTPQPDGAPILTYGVAESLFGLCFVGLIEQGVCALSFIEKKDIKTSVADLCSKWPLMVLERDDKRIKLVVKDIFSETHSTKSVDVILEGTDFQIQVWEALLSVPLGKTVSYADIARKIKAPKAVRAVGTACGANNVAFLIPCHRIIDSQGGMGGYRWGIEKKKKILAWEAKITTQ
jgi:AraC family transcriptional regulator of adaptative response/methylated-DNA-[protein]-cysteine methyltransferase